MFQAGNLVFSCRQQLLSVRFFCTKKAAYSATRLHFFFPTYCQGGLLSDHYTVFRIPLFQSVIHSFFQTFQRFFKSADPAEKG